MCSQLLQSKMDDLMHIYLSVNVISVCLFFQHSLQTAYSSNSSICYCSSRDENMKTYQSYNKAHLLENTLLLGGCYFSGSKDIMLFSFKVNMTSKLTMFTFTIHVAVFISLLNSDNRIKCLSNLSSQCNNLLRLWKDFLIRMISPRCHGGWTAPI